MNSQRLRSWKLMWKLEQKKMCNIPGYRPIKSKKWRTTTAIRQLLRTPEEVSEKPFLSPKPTDKCFKCGEEGHWAKECKKEIPHDSAWLPRQRCYTCGQYGHLKKDCELDIRNGKINKNITPLVTDINIDHDPLTIQLLCLPEVNLKDHPKVVPSQPCDGSGIHHSERFMCQGSDTWKEARKGKVNGSRAACAFGWRGRQEMIKYAKEVKSAWSGDKKWMYEWCYVLGIIVWGSCCCYIYQWYAMKKIWNNRTLGNNWW